ncbi:hypothetical protein BTJ68_01181 [Hortaea werneckii EXF-2000]|uniref:Lysyl-tRNA synthetase n=1 Tax=Hortaea werneckii EXF-2000 TaxID=1157616 RepID=A0A1Z5TRP8_HORWE|nr:hypothetical protein BTJ68_01181 [Hortaea werneckii EXF-2000]
MQATSRHLIQCPRPYLFHGFRRVIAPRAFSQASCFRQAERSRDVTHDYEKRVAQLQAQRPLEECYPRLPSREEALVLDRKLYSAAHVHTVATELQNGETVTHDEPTTLIGRVKSVRTAGSKLVFVDIQCEDGSIQVVSQLGKLTDITPSQFKNSTRTIRKGDWYSFSGWPHKTQRGEVSLLANQLPHLLSPSLHQIPETLDDAETRARNRHVDMLANPSAVQPLLVRHHIIQALRDHLNKTQFVEVTTPLLTAGAGGAVARPFETEATELEGQKLNLRIAPELWLKRLIVGGMSRIYEIGPAFRNEGVDATHNPEFTICEFYEACATLDSLMTKTEVLLREMKQRIDEARATASSDPVSSGSSRLKDLPEVELDLQWPFRRLEFIPALEEAMKTPLPNLSTLDAHENLLSLFTAQNLDIPTKPTLPRLLDALAAHYLEPLCTQPTFITHHPAALSPLSKLFRCPQTGQTIAARAELFIRGREYANMYEEENSPFAQRRNFLEQLRYRAVDGEGDGVKEVDESYLEALEWGMPPTGGWGCGVDRLVMLFSGRERMSEVLAFGSLRNVVGLGRARR